MLPIGGLKEKLLAAYRHGIHEAILTKDNQKDLPDMRGDVVLESAFEMDFKPGAKAGQRNTLRIDKPGVYLVRVESRQTDSDHEHFSAIDLGVDAKRVRGR